MRKPTTGFGLGMLFSWMAMGIVPTFALPVVGGVAAAGVMLGDRQSMSPKNIFTGAAVGIPLGLFGPAVYGYARGLT